MNQTERLLNELDALKPKSVQQQVEWESIKKEGIAEFLFGKGYDYKCVRKYLVDRIFCAG